VPGILEWIKCFDVYMAVMYHKQPARRHCHLASGGHYIIPHLSWNHLVITADQKPPTRQIFAMYLSSYIKETGLDVTHYNTHSFRIGAATSAMAASVSDAHMKMLGH